MSQTTKQLVFFSRLEGDAYNYFDQNATIDTDYDELLEMFDEQFNHDEKKHTYLIEFLNKQMDESENVEYFINDMCRLVRFAFPLESPKSQERRVKEQLAYALTPNLIEKFLKKDINL